MSIDTAMQPCEDWKVRGMAIVGDWGGHSMSLADCLWAVISVVCDGQSLFMNG